MKWVCLLQSIPHPDRHYVGLADDFPSRFAAHNAGRSKYASRWKPWKVVVLMEFEDDARAIAFEQDLKSGSGQSFAKRHFW